VAADGLIVEVEHFFARRADDFVLSFPDDSILDVLRTCPKVDVGPPFELTVERVGNTAGLGNHVGSRVVSEYEPYAVIVPTVELRGQRKIGVASQ
jgi:hypothetical protein